MAKAFEGGIRGKQAREKYKETLAAEKERQGDRTQDRLQHVAEIQGIAEMEAEMLIAEAKLKALQVRIQGAKEAAHVARQAVEGEAQRKQRAFENLAKVHSFGAQVSSFFQELLIAMKAQKKENSVKRKREDIYADLDDANSLLTRARTARGGQVANHQSILAALGAINGTRTNGGQGRQGGEGQSRQVPQSGNQERGRGRNVASAPQEVRQPAAPQPRQPERVQPAAVQVERQPAAAPTPATETRPVPPVEDTDGENEDDDDESDAPAASATAGGRVRRAVRPAAPRQPFGGSRNGTPEGGGTPPRPRRRGA